ncbi:MAG: hypothetical protein BMS9Abin13_295 [Patescibacteria group bacterium]|nr:MAG: hypothetical protein BMS9Abin13_295 [Patescibacteria group bacterium]
MVIIATGISGAGKKEYLKRFEKYASSLGKRVKIYHVGELLLARAAEDGLNITHKNILNTNKHTIVALRSAVYESILNDYEKNKKKYDVVIVSIHGFFYWKKTFHHSYDHSYINKFNPDLFMTIMGDAVDIKKELDVREQRKEEKLSLEEILLWQNVETEVMMTWAGLNGKPFYAFFNTQSLATFYKLAFLPEMETVYLSMPMTHLKDEKDKKRIVEFAKKLEEYFTVFVPLEGKGGLPDVNAGLSADTLAEYTTSHQAVKVDLDLLLNQSKRIIVFFPKAVSSPGAINELREAHETNKGAWVIYPSETVSPFLTFYLDKSFKDEKDFFVFLKREQKGKKRFTEKLN